MKAPNGGSSLLLLTLVTICELKFQTVVVDNKKVTIETDFLAELKEELNVPPVPETEIFSAAYDDDDHDDDHDDGEERKISHWNVQTDVTSPNQSVTEETTIKLNLKVHTLALTALHQSSKVKVCCPKSLIKWQKKHKMETSQALSNCKAKITEPKRRR